MVLSVEGFLMQMLDELEICLIMLLLDLYLCEVLAGRSFSLGLVVSQMQNQADFIPQMNLKLLDWKDQL